MRLCRVVRTSGIFHCSISHYHKHGGGGMCKQNTHTHKIYKNKDIKMYKNKDIKMYKNKDKNMRKLILELAIIQREELKQLLHLPNLILA